MTRRETYPCAGLESILQATSIVKQEFMLMSKTSEYGISRDALRLTEILGFIERRGRLGKSVLITHLGKQLLSVPQEQQKIMLFRALLKQNDVLPPYFKKLLEMPEIHNTKLPTKELCQKLNMKDLWSADILNEWCRYLGISKGRTKSEVFISSQKVAEMRKKAFALTVQEEYTRLAGSSGLVPVAKLRRELKNSGILGPNDDFDEWLGELKTTGSNEAKITFHPAPAKFVGRGLKGKVGYELISISGTILSGEV